MIKLELKYSKTMFCKFMLMLLFTFYVDTSSLHSLLLILLSVWFGIESNQNRQDCGPKRDMGEFHTQPHSLIPFSDHISQQVRNKDCHGWYLLRKCSCGN